MTSYLQAELISTGAELLSGRSVNTHARLLGERLARLGIALRRDTTIPDDLRTIQRVLQDAMQRVDLVFVSGGLGPTNDDITRQAVAEILKRRVVTDEASLRTLRERMRRAGRAMNAARERQAQIVEGATALSNAVGAAPGQRIEYADKVLFLLPGPPAEFEAVLDDHVVPWLREQLAGGTALRERILLVCGLAEADIVQRFEAADFPPAGIATAYCAGAGRVEVRLHPDSDTSEAALDQATDRAAALLGEAVYARERVELEELVGHRLKAQGQTLASAESCTGGLIGERITSVSGSSAWYLGGIISYADAVKVRELGVDSEVLAREGAVSDAVVRQMAEGVRTRFAADYGLAVTGIAGPSGGTADKPVGLVHIAVAHPDGTTAERHVFPGNRATVREWTCRAALMLLQKVLPVA